MVPVAARIRSEPGGGRGRNGVVIAAALAVGMVIVPAGASADGPPPGSQLWVKRYDGPVHEADGAASIAADPTADRVYVTGGSLGSGDFDFATVAYNGRNGRVLWARRYDGPAGGTDQAVGVVAGEGRVFVTGTSEGEGTESDFATIAYDGETGSELWVARHDGPRHREDTASALALAPDGSSVFVTGKVAAHLGDYATVAYDSATGAELWTRQHDGFGGTDTPFSIAASDDRVFVTGASGRGDRTSYATLAYEAAGGQELWNSRFDGPGGLDIPSSVVVPPRGGLVFVSGFSREAGGGFDFATLALDSATGEVAWKRRFGSPGGFDSANDATVTADGSMLVVTGSTEQPSGGFDLDYTTVAYSARSGTMRWVARYAGSNSGFDVATAIDASPAGVVFVTGNSTRRPALVNDIGTLAYDAATGEQLWRRLYDSPLEDLDYDNGEDIAVSPNGARVFVAGASPRADTEYDYVTVAYST